MNFLYKFIAFVVVLVVGIVAAINFDPYLTMNPNKSGNFSNSSISIVENGKNNVFLINSTVGYIMIDTGSDLKVLREELKRLNINASDVKYVLLTHRDCDHVARISLFKNARLYVNEDMLQVNGSNKCLSDRDSLDIDPNSVDLIGDEELILGGVKVKAIKAPGHAPGNMIYIVDDKYLFSGDAIEISNNILKQHPFVFDEKKSKESINIIKDVIKNLDYVFTLHYGYFKVENLN